MTFRQDTACLLPKIIFTRENFHFVSRPHYFKQKRLLRYLERIFSLHNCLCIQSGFSVYFSRLGPGSTCYSRANATYYQSNILLRSNFSQKAFKTFLICCDKLEHYCTVPFDSNALSTSLPLIKDIPSNICGFVRVKVFAQYIIHCLWLTNVKSESLKMVHGT